MLALSTPRTSAAVPPQDGQFHGRVVVEWLQTEAGPDRDMRLVERFAFRDPSGSEWSVPVGAVVNGASIPRVLWTLVGSPFVGNYRRASVVHDHFCAVKTRPWQTVHRMFYNAMLAGGVSVSRAKTMYAAVYGEGPRWDSSGTPQHSETRPMTEDELRDLEGWIKRTDPELAEIEERVMRRAPHADLLAPDRPGHRRRDLLDFADHYPR